MRFSEAIMLGAIGVTPGAFAMQPFDIATRAAGENEALGAWPFLMQKNVELDCCGKECEYGPALFCRLAHLWDKHYMRGGMTLEQYVAKVQELEPQHPWRSEAEKIEWLTESVTEVLRKEREIKAVAQSDGDEGDGA